MKSFFKFNKPGNSNNLDKPGFFNLNGLNGPGKSPGPGNQGNRRKIKPATVFLILAFFGIIIFYFFNTRQSAPVSAEMAQPASGVGGLDLIVKLVIGIAIVSALIYITVFILRFFYAKRGKVNLPAPVLSKGLINVLECINLDSGRRLHLVKIADKTLLLSSSESQVSLIKEFKNEEIEKAVCEAKVKENESMQEEKNFKSIFLRLFKNNI